MLDSWKQALGGILAGGVLGVAGTFFLFQGRITSQEEQLKNLQEKIQKLGSDNADSKKQDVPLTQSGKHKRSCSGVSILSPLEGATVSASKAVEVVGSYAEDFPIERLVLIHVNQGNGWPQDAIELKPARRFNGRAYLNASGSIVAALIEPEQRVLFDYYFKVGREAKTYLPIERLLDVVTECARVTVVVPDT